MKRRLRDFCWVRAHSAWVAAEDVRRVYAVPRVSLGEARIGICNAVGDWWWALYITFGGGDGGTA